MTGKEMVGEEMAVCSGADGTTGDCGRMTDEREVGVGDEDRMKAVWRIEHMDNCTQRLQYRDGGAGDCGGLVEMMVLEMIQLQHPIKKKC